MFQKPTVVVLGAGASYECDMPLGADLLRTVAGKVRFKSSRDQVAQRVRLALRERDIHKWPVYVQAGEQLAQTIDGFPSIDEALHYWRFRPDIVELGKLAIVDAILQAEASSKLKPKQNSIEPDLDRLHDSWYFEFFQAALRGADSENVDTIFANVTVVNFNYDRTLEQYLYWALQRFAGVEHIRAQKTVQSLRILRPYGSVGHLDWQADAGLSFGDDKFPSRYLLEAATKIRTFTEQHHLGVPERISEALDGAQLVLILGFGFLRQNMQLLKATTQHGWFRRVFATVVRIDSENHPDIATRLNNQLMTYREYVRVLDKPAYRLLFDLRPTIEAAAN